MKSLSSLGQGESQRYKERELELRKMRWIATGLLVSMAIVFVIAKHAEHELGHPWGFVRAFAEAGMVGGLADWFAVTALFRYPMGIPIPHTAIIPTNKERIGRTLANFLRGNFMTTKVVAKRIRNIDVASAVGRFLANPQGGEGRMRMGASRMIGDVVGALDDERLGKMAKQALRSQLDRLNVAPLLGQLLHAAIANNKHSAVLDGIIKWSAKTLESNEQVIQDMISERTNAVMRWTGLDEKLSNAIINGLNKLLVDMAADPNHSLRAKGEEGLSQLAHDLVHDKKLQKKVEGWKRELLENPAIGTWIDDLWQQGRQALLNAARNPDATFAGNLGDALLQLGSTLQEDTNLKSQINRFARRAIVGTTENYGDNIVRLVSDTIQGWDAKTITDRVENAVGSDLQFIRINGTIVGGLAGLAIHSIGLWL